MNQFKIKVEEWYAVTLSFIYYFCVLGAYYVMRPIRDQLAVEVGSAQLPGFFAVTFLATLLLTPLFSWMVSRWPRRVIMPTVYLFFIACQLLFITFFSDRTFLSIRTFAMIFFVWVSIFNLFVVSVFWSFMTDIWSDLQARRLFPIIALGGTIGAIIGPLITRNLVGLIGSALLLLVSAGLLCVAVACVMLLGQWAHQHGVHRDEPGSEAALGGGMWDGFKQIFTNPFIGSMAIMMLLSDAIGTISYVLVTDYSGFAFPNQVIAQTRFAATMDLSANIIQIAVQLTVTRWLLVRYGAGLVFITCAFVVVFTCLMMALVPNQYAPLIGIMPPVAIVMILTRALSHAMLQPARETLYTLVLRELRYKGKNAVDTVVWRAGDVMSLMSVNGLRALGVTVAGFEALWAVFACIAGCIGWSLSKRVEKGK